MVRSDNLVRAAYFLARCGTHAPPEQLETSSWARAYSCFFAALGNGRTHRTFRNTLKSSRDEFDGHVPNARRGWQKPLPDQNERILRAWSGRSDEEIWESVREFADLRVATVEARILHDLDAEIAPLGEHVMVGFDGESKARVTTVRERDPALRDVALRLHGTSCQACGFDFETFYGEWGRGFAEVHHVELLSEAPAHGRVVDPRADLVVLCANCHRMVHREAGRVLSIADLRNLITQARRR